MPRRNQLLTIAAIALFAMPAVVWATDTDSSFQAKLEEMRQRKEEFLRTKSEALETTTRTDAQRAQLLAERAAMRKTTLLRIVDVQISYFERMQDRVSNMPNITDEEKAKLDTAITDVIADLTALKTEIEGTATDDEDALKSLAQEVQAAFKTKHALVKEIVKAIHASHLTTVLNRANERLAAIETRIDELAADGKDVTALTALLNQAKTSLTEAQSQLSAGEFREALKSIKEAYSLFRQIIQAGKEL